MTARGDEAYILTPDELLLLAAGSGIARFAWLCREEPRKYSREETLMCLHGLVERGLLVADGEAFRMEKGLKACIDRIGHARRYIDIVSADEYLPRLCVYIADEGILTAEMRRFDFELRLCASDATALADILDERGYLPAESYIDCPSPLNGGHESTVLSARLFSADGGELGGFSICDNGLSHIIRHGGEPDAVVYHKKSFAKLLAMLTGG